MRIVQRKDHLLELTNPINVVTDHWSALTHNYLLISLDYTATPRTLMSRSLGPFSPYFSFKEVLLLLNSPILVLTSPASISLLLRTSHCTATPTSAWHSGCKDDPGWISSQGGALHIDGEGGVPYCIAMNGIGTSIALRWIILHLIGFAGRRHLIAALPLYQLWPNPPHQSSRPWDVTKT